MSNTVLEEDLRYTFSHLTEAELEKFSGATILITGCGGFLGQYHLSFLEKYARELQVKKVIGIDTFLLGVSPLIRRLKANPLFDIRELDVARFSESDIMERYQIDYVLHMASIASPSYYRQHPLETIDSNIWGMRNLLDALKGADLKGFLFYSSSEVYGDPADEMVPTEETYWGSVSCLGPRACYDESKRFGETLCWVYHRMFQMPVRIVRLFNVYGPGLKMNDRRAPADFAMSVMHDRDIKIFSNGQPTRTFCYVADSCVGELKALFSSRFDVYNIGSDSGEMRIEEFASLFQEIAATELGYHVASTYQISDDPDYLVHDPQRRCPDLRKAREQLGFEPSIGTREGVGRYLRYLKEEGENAIW